MEIQDAFDFVEEIAQVGLEYTTQDDRLKFVEALEIVNEVKRFAIPRYHR